MAISKHKTPCILITIDVEDWFQVENFKSYIPFSTWDACELRVEKNVHKLLDLFDSIDLNKKNNSKSSPREIHSNESEADFTGVKNQNSKLPRKVKATFFVLGWLAERLPHMVREIDERGHEVASHGFNHNLCNTINKNDLKKELLKSKKLLEDITGSEVCGYRAPSFSIDNDILKVIEDCGYKYDSSYNSFRLHSRYGKINLNSYLKHGIAIKLSDSFYELPISNLTLKAKLINNLQIPLGGGGYFRFIPFLIFKMAVRSVLKNESVYLFYIHPWELDPSQPRVHQAKPSYKFRHYANLSKNSKKISKFINGFSRNQFMSCAEYLEKEIQRDSR